ncbi:MAG: CsbD family protein [Opitutaceae bacterium]
MNTETLKGNWHIVKGQLKETYPILTDHDILYTAGKEEELIGRIQLRTGAKRDEIERIFEGENTFHP